MLLQTPLFSRWSLPLTTLYSELRRVYIPSFFTVGPTFWLARFRGFRNVARAIEGQVRQHRMIPWMAHVEIAHTILELRLESLGGNIWKSVFIQSYLIEVLSKLCSLYSA